MSVRRAATALLLLEAGAVICFWLYLALWTARSDGFSGEPAYDNRYANAAQVVYLLAAVGALAALALTAWLLLGGGRALPRSLSVAGRGAAVVIVAVHAVLLVSAVAGAYLVWAAILLSPTVLLVLALSAVPWRAGAKEG